MRNVRSVGQWRVILHLRGKHASPSQQGQSAVEIALMLPVLLILLFGIIVSAFIFYASIQVSNAAREGARAGSLYRLTYPTMVCTTACMKNTVTKAVYTSSTQHALGGLPVSSSNPTISVSWSTTNTNPNRICIQDNPCSGDLITATVAYTYTERILSGFLPFFPRDLLIQRSVMMEVQ
jgi:Flp pilus assembly protein TadG